MELGNCQGVEFILLWKYADSHNLFSVWRETFFVLGFYLLWHNGAQQAAVIYRTCQLPEVDTEEKEEEELPGSIGYKWIVGKFVHDLFWL